MGLCNLLYRKGETKEMKAILLNATPLQIEELQKTGKIEVGTHSPKETPFKVYLYCRKSNDFLLDIDPNNGNSLFFCWDKKGCYPFKYERTDDIFNGHVVAEFVVKATEKVCKKSITKIVNKIQNSEISFTNGEYIHSIWYSSNFKIYDFGNETPKALFEFKRPCLNTDCEKCLGKPYKLDSERMRVKIICPRKLIHAPQSWCYVEEI